MQNQTLNKTSDIHATAILTAMMTSSAGQSISVSVALARLHCFKDNRFTVICLGRVTCNMTPKANENLKQRAQYVVIKNHASYSSKNCLIKYRENEHVFKRIAG